MKLRDEMATQHHATFKQEVEINEKTEGHTVHNQKMKTILLQVNDLLGHLDQSLLKRSEADLVNNKALLRVVEDLSGIRAQLEDLQRKEGTPNRPPQPPSRNPEAAKGEHPQNPLTVPSQTPPHQPPQSTTLHRRATNKKLAQLKKKHEDARKAETPKWKPAVIPDPAMDAEVLGLDDIQATTHKWPPPPLVEDEADPAGEDEDKTTCDEKAEPVVNANIDETESTAAKGDDQELQIPLRDLWHKYNQELDSYQELENTVPDPSQTLLWNANGIHPDNALRLCETAAKDRAIRPEREKIREYTQDLLENLEEELQEILTPPSQPHDPYAVFLQNEKENKRLQERERSRLHAETQLALHGARPPGRENHLPQMTADQFTQIEEETIPIDPRIERNRFGMVSPDPDILRIPPPMSPGGRHIGEGSQRVSVVSVKVTLGGKHAEAGSK